MEKKKSYKYLIIIAIIIPVLFGISYAYYLAVIKGNNSSVKGTATNTFDINLVTDSGGYITATNMIPIVSDDIANLSNKGVFKVVAGNNEHKVTYSLSLTNISISTNLKVADFKWDLINKDTTTSIASGNFASVSSTLTLASNLTIEANTTTNYELRIYILETDSDQTSQMNGTFSAKVTLTADMTYNPSSTHINYANTYLMGKVGTSGSGGLKSISQAATTQLRATTEYRYYGANPNNYVTFNGELWRIIGVFETENESGTLEYRVKLIRNQPIGSYSWDTSASTVNSGWGINEWSQSDLMKLLNPGYESNQDLNNSGATITVNNSLYWTKGSGTCYNGLSNATTTCDFTSTGLGTEAKSMIDKAKFYTSGWNTSSITSNQFYTYERGSAVISSPSDGITRTTSWVGYIGLMYLSDYGYATDESLCASSITLFEYDIISCYTNDWLWRSVYFYWSIIPNLSESSSVWIVSGAGEASSNHTSINYYAGKPVLYLKSNVQITGGEGSSTNPYTLAI